MAAMAPTEQSEARMCFVVEDLLDQAHGLGGASARLAALVASQQSLDIRGADGRLVMSKGTPTDGATFVPPPPRRKPGQRRVPKPVLKPAPPIAGTDSIGPSDSISIQTPFDAAGGLLLPGDGPSLGFGDDSIRFGEASPRLSDTASLKEQAIKEDSLNELLAELAVETFEDHAGTLASTAVSTLEFQETRSRLGKDTKLKLVRKNGRSYVHVSGFTRDSERLLKGTRYRLDNAKLDFLAFGEGAKGTLKRALSKGNAIAMIAGTGVDVAMMLRDGAPARDIAGKVGSNVVVGLLSTGVAAGAAKIGSMALVAAVGSATLFTVGGFIAVLAVGIAVSVALDKLGFTDFLEENIARAWDWAAEKVGAIELPDLGDFEPVPRLREKAGELGDLMDETFSGRTERADRTMCVKTCC